MILIKIIGEEERFLKKTLKHNIPLLKIKKHPNYLLVKIYEKDLNKIIKLNYYSKIEIIKYYGIKGIIFHIKKRLYDYLMLIIFLIGIYIMSNIIVSVDIIHEDAKLRNMINEELINYNVRPFTIYKSNKKLNEIVTNILKNNKDQLDWMSITRDGMHYTVAFEERIINHITTSKKYCHVIAKKDGVIRKMTVNHGIALLESGTTVKKGDIIITGEIILNDEIKDNTCASGEVIGETWYKATISYPLNHIQKKYTRRYRHNISIDNKSLFKDHYPIYEEQTLKTINIFNKKIRLIKEKEYTINNQKYSPTEAKKGHFSKQKGNY